MTWFCLHYCTDFNDIESCRKLGLFWCSIIYTWELYKEHCRSNQRKSHSSSSLQGTFLWYWCKLPIFRICSLCHHLGLAGFFNIIIVFVVILLFITRQRNIKCYYGNYPHTNALKTNLSCYFCFQMLLIVVKEYLYGDCFLHLCGTSSIRYQC